jgi:hypothetical protein
MTTKPSKTGKKRKVTVKIDQDGNAISESPLKPRAIQTNWRKQMQDAKIKFTDRAKAIYCEHLAATGSKGGANRAANTSTATVRRHMESDPDFEAAVYQAEEDWADTFLTHAKKLMMEGEKTVHYDKDGNVSSESVKYPTPLIAMEMKKVDEGYRDKQQIEHGAIGGGVLVAPAEMTPTQWIEHQDTVNNEKPDEAPDRSDTKQIESK